MGEFEKALAQFDPLPFCLRHGGYKESASASSQEYLLTCRCGSERLRWCHNPPVKNAWLCWSCSKSGDTQDLIAWLEDCSLNDAADLILEGYVGGDAPQHLSAIAKLRTQYEGLRLLPALKLPREYQPLNASHTQAVHYLQYRGVNIPEAVNAGVGYCPTGKLKGYLIFPCLIDGSVVYWQGRAAWDPPPGTSEERKAWVKATHYRKTMNPYGREGFATAADILYNYDRARAFEHVVVTEGPIDANQVGPHATALLGKAISPQKVERLMRIPCSRLTIYLDRGEEERRAAEKLATQLSDFARIYIATPPESHDPGSLTPEQNAHVIAHAELFQAAPALQGGLKPF